MSRKLLRIAVGLVITLGFLAGWTGRTSCFSIIIALGLIVAVCVVGRVYLGLDKYGASGTRREPWQK